MGDKYINGVGLQAIKTWSEGKFALDADLDALDAKVDEIIAEGGEPNVIETVKVNNTALVPDAQKAVNVKTPKLVPTGINTFEIQDENNASTMSFMHNNGVLSVEAEFQNYQDYPLDMGLASTDYVDANGGKIDVIKVNGTAQTITNKEVDLPVPTKVSDLTNDSNFQTDTQVDTKIASAVAAAVTLKGSVATYSALPSTGQKHGDMYDVLDTGKNYVWIVEEGTGRWDDYAGTMDMSAYWTSTAGQANTLEAMTVAEINAILEPSA